MVRAAASRVSGWARWEARSPGAVHGGYSRRQPHPLLPGTAVTMGGMVEVVAEVKHLSLP